VDKPDIFVPQNAEYTCSICIPEIAVKADGANHKVSGNKKYDSLAVKQVGDTTVLFTRQKAGKVVGESTETASPDGSTFERSRGTKH